MVRLAKILAMIAMGVFVPYWRGWTTIDPLFLLPFACFSALLVAPLISTALPVSHAVGQACGIMLGILLIAVATVNVILWTGQVILPDASTIFAAFALCISSASATAAVLRMLSRHFSPFAIRWSFRLAVAFVVIGYRNFPLEWSIAWSQLIFEFGVGPFAISCATALAIIAICFSRTSSTRTHGGAG